MTLNDPLASTLSNIWNAEKVGKKECTTSPSSKIIISVLKILKENGFIKDFKNIENGKGGLINISLSNNINKCLANKPRYNVKISDYEKFEKRYLPAKDFGIVIVSTNKGIMTHKEAIQKKLGGRLLAYCY